MSEDSFYLPLGKRCGLAAALTLGIWLLIAWPLPLHVSRGVPTAAHREPPSLQRMIPGDHLQFMYYCWLAGDMLAGKTPLFYNLYEFDNGQVLERFEPDTYYLPFSAVYAAAARLGGRAFGWNATGWVSLWLTCLWTWLLARRWTDSEWAAALGAALGLALPFRWINLFGGSPAGFAMAWIPAALLGVDWAAREDRIGGGALAGAALLLASWGDRHVFFFGTLLAPVWGLAVWIARTGFARRRPAAYGRAALALWPAAAGVGLALLFPFFMKAVTRAVTGAPPVAHAIGPRDIREALLFSPDWRGLLGTSPLAMGEHIYLGALLAVLLALGGAALALRFRRRRAASPEAASRAARDAASYLFLLAVLAGIAALALGPRGPLDGWAFRWARTLIPPYALIRQPAKIFCLVPSLLGVVWALAITAWMDLAGRAAAGGNARWRILVRAGVLLAPALLTAAVIADYARRAHPTISALEPRQDAYAAVASDAAARKGIPRALVLPLWPGDSHYASIYQYFASLYRVRMLNGYNPFIREGYFENVFRRFESANQGRLDSGQIQALLDMRARYVILHEDLFPEKVSPFPVKATLSRLRDHPRLEFLEQDGSVWAFRILDDPRPTRPQPPPLATLFPARRVEWEQTPGARRGRMVREDAAAGRGGYAAMTEPGSVLETPPFRVAAVSNLHWLVRLRGRGTLAAACLEDGRELAAGAPAAGSEAWTWVSIPVPVEADWAERSLKLTLAGGALDLDLCLLAAGRWPQLTPGQSLTLPAALFFHAGHEEAGSESVVFRPDFDRQGHVLYGPKMPFPAGTYEVELACESPAAPGRELAVVNLEQDEATGRGTMLRIEAGAPARARWRHAENLPFNLVLLYRGTDVLTIRTVSFTRLK